MSTELIDALETGVLVVDAEGIVRQANRWVRERARAPGPLAGRALSEAFGQPVEPRLLLAVRGCLDLGNAVRLSQAFHPMPLPLYLPGDGAGQRLRQSVDIRALPPSPGETGATASASSTSTPATPRSCLIQVRDVSESVRREQLYKSQARHLQQQLQHLTLAHQEIERQSARFREMARLAPVGLFETDLAGRLHYCNARVAELLGGEPQLLQDRPWTELFAAQCRDTAQRHRDWEAAAASGVRFAAEFCLDRHPGARPIWLRVEASAIRAADGSAQGHIFTLVDVSELREQARRSEVRANHDKLTGLVNRDRFEAAVADRLQRLVSVAPGSELTVMFIDLDRFKLINDGHGHHAGDLVLKAVAARLRRCVRSQDVVARLGGDEFAVLLPDPLPPDVVERVAGRIDKAVSLPINIGSCHVTVGASVGWSSAVADGQGSNVEALLRAADAAMYRSKRGRLAPGLPAATPTPLNLSPAQRGPARPATEAANAGP